MRIILLLLIGLQLIADEQVNRLEDQFIKKANILKEDYENRSMKLAKNYIKALEQLKVEKTKQGDLEGALLVKEKIKELSPVIADDKPKKYTIYEINQKGHWIIRYKVVGNKAICIYRKHLPTNKEWEKEEGFGTGTYIKNKEGIFIQNVAENGKTTDQYYTLKTNGETGLTDKGVFKRQSITIKEIK